MANIYEKAIWENSLRFIAIYYFCKVYIIDIGQGIKYVSASYFPWSYIWSVTRQTENNVARLVNIFTVKSLKVNPIGQTDTFYGQIAIGQTNNSDQKWCKNSAADITRWTKISKGPSVILEKRFGIQFQFFAPEMLKSSKTNYKVIAFNYNVWFWALEFNDHNNEDPFILLLVLNQNHFLVKHKKAT